MYRGRVELVEIKEEEVRTILKRMKKRRAPGIDEVRADMIIAGEEVRVSLRRGCSIYVSLQFQRIGGHG